MQRGHNILNGVCLFGLDYWQVWQLWVYQSMSIHIFGKLEVGAKYFRVFDLTGYPAVGMF
jgi:hypothetical protein